MCMKLPSIGHAQCKLALSERAQRCWINIDVYKYSEAMRHLLEASIMWT